ncbi:hypothetical protein, no similarity [Maudiozyma barnettii]|uniref:Uncharacterized protein n=1 Tax=Maudiozyma barnettii TaxID=61262 RepID=A0A8H2VIG1_9SACH|nr:hypothetical protein, no similarity [Kazachstania barnettii]CAB4256062.1 hypothetical protein, no similarity [Kazachstania barnettii]CAD1784670.1 hypothetical protein, no similarity [Kazachstania barnettii]
MKNERVNNMRLVHYDAHPPFPLLTRSSAKNKKILRKTENPFSCPISKSGNCASHIISRSGKANSRNPLCLVFCHHPSIPPPLKTKKINFFYFHHPSAIVSREQTQQDEIIRQLSSKRKKKRTASSDNLCNHFCGTSGFQKETAVNLTTAYSNKITLSTPTSITFFTFQLHFRKRNKL